METVSVTDRHIMKEGIQSALINLIFPISYLNPYLMALSIGHERKNYFRKQFERNYYHSPLKILLTIIHT